MPRVKTIAGLEKQLAAVTELLAGLKKKRAGLAKQLAGIDKRIAVLAGKPQAATKPAKKAAAKTRKRARNKASLGDALAEALKGRGDTGIPDAVKLVQAAGYTSKCKVFPKLVGQAMANDKRFQKVSRGVYKLA